MPYFLQIVVGGWVVAGVWKAIYMVQGLPHIPLGRVLVAVVGLQFLLLFGEVYNNHHG